MGAGPTLQGVGLPERLREAQRRGVARLDAGVGDDGHDLGRLGAGGGGAGAPGKKVAAPLA